jgi:hypothetical protein
MAVNLILVDTDGRLIYGHALTRRVVRHGEYQQFEGRAGKFLCLSGG